MNRKIKIAIVPLSCILVFGMFDLYGSSKIYNKDDWPRWRGPGQNGKSEAKDVFKFEEGLGLQIAWKKGLGSGYSSVSIADGRALTMFSDGQFDYMVAFDAQNGDELWRFKIDSTYKGHNGSDDGPTSTPLITDDLVFGLGPNGQLFALNVSDGKQVWLAHLVKDHMAVQPYWGFATSPLIHDNILVVQTGGTQENAVSGFDKNTGKLLWSNGNYKINYQSPVSFNFNGLQQIICAGDEYIFSINPKTGTKLWQYQHNGNGLYLGNQSINPVIFNGNQIFLTYKTTESLLLSINVVNDEYRVEEIWKSPNLKGSLSAAVYHQGHLYGYNGRNFLTCVEAKSGDTVWKSRPPGEGFLILVDGHLVVQTKKGSLKIIEATPSEYREKAGLKVFSELSWTAPSFANGKFYVRNAEEIACVEVARIDHLTTRSPKTEFSNSKFVSFIEKVNRAEEDKKVLIDNFMSSQKRFPVIENDTLAHVVYRGEVEDLGISSDLWNWNEQMSMNRVGATDLYYYSMKLESDAKIQYKLIRNFDEAIPDLLNPISAHTIYTGEASQLIMPKAKTLPDNYVKPAQSNSGRIDSLSFKSEVFEIERRIDVYLPFGYEQSQGNYPVVYFNQGDMMLEFAKMHYMLDNLIGSQIKPIIAVFVYQHPQFKSQEFTRMRDKYAQMIIDELVPYIDQKYQTQSKPEYRAITGGDRGGYISLFIGFKHPGVFGMIGSQSTFLEFGVADGLIKMISNSERLPLTIYLDWGKYDLRNQDFKLDWPAQNRKLYTILRELGYQVFGGEVNEGISWENWRSRADKLLERFVSLKD